VKEEDKMKKGRPTKLSPEVTKMISDAIRAGNYIEVAAAYANIDKATFYDWLKKGQRLKVKLAKKPDYLIDEEEQAFIDFSNATKKALADAEVRDVILIGEAAKRSWQAAAWRLERKFPEKWGLNKYHQKIEVERLKIEKERLKLEKQKIQGPDDAFKMHQIQLNTLADLLNNPAPNRNPSDFDQN
jgi:hypothetical protein